MAFKERTNNVKPLVNYRTIWRWHFYAGLFSIPFIIWLSITGSIYLFKPQIDAWEDRPYDHLVMSGARASPEQQACAALAAVPRSTLHHFEIPKSPDAATRVLVGKGTQEFRVYVNPQTLSILRVFNEDHRFTQRIFHLHGELLMSTAGSVIVETASSWAIVLIATGLFLWWPRQTQNLAGVLYIRVRKGRRLFFRDLHAVTGIWISTYALFLLFTGLQWATVWGAMFHETRTVLSRHLVHEDWPTGPSSELRNRVAINKNSMPGMDMGPATADTTSAGGTVQHELEPLNRVVPAAASLHLAYPALVSPPAAPGEAWTAKSDNQNRLLRTHATIDGATGAILSTTTFYQQSWLDRVLALSVSMHEGQLFGIANQVVGALTCLGLVTLSLSAIALWWQRREDGVLGAPVRRHERSIDWKFLPIIAAFALYLPMLAVTILLVLMAEKWVLPQFPRAYRWLGLEVAS
jgi:uncharacterized iron-regulated membrane protein